MNDLKIFESADFGKVRTMVINDEPWFVAKDVAEALGYANASKAITDHVDDDDKLNNESLSSLGQRGGWIINESGLYSLIMSSKLPGAKAFKRWVTTEVLPSIRKHGAYMTEQTIEKALTDPDFLIRLATNLKEEQMKRIAAEAKVEEMKPKVLFADAVETSQRSCLVAELAKILKQNGVDTGQNRLFSWLRGNGYLCTKGEYYNQPTQKAMDMGFFELKKRTVNNPDGTVMVVTTTKVTPKGQIFFVNKFCEKK